MDDLSHPDYPTLQSFVSYRDEVEAAITSLAALPEKLSWTSLTLTGHKISLLNGISDFPSLRTLFVSDCEVESLESAEDWGKLHTIDLSFNELKNIDALKELPLTQSLNLSHNQLKHLPINLNWPQLEELALSANESRLLQLGLPQIPQLKRLYMKQLSIPQKTIWCSFPKLKELYATAGESGIDVRDLAQLELLHLHLKTGFDLSTLQLPESLRNLTLTQGQNLQNIHYLEQYHFLEVLSLHYLPIKNWGFIANLTNLRTLNLKGSYNNLEDIRDSFPNLQLNA